MSVLIVGAGPSGLTAAYTLAKAGVVPRIIDFAPGPHPESRALVVWPRTMELLGEDFVARIAKEGNRIDKASLNKGHNGKKIGAIILKDKDDANLTPHPYCQGIPQNKVEEVLIGMLKENFGVQVEYATKLLSMEARDDGNSVVLGSPTGEESRHEFDYVIGCDGSHSKVREAAGITVKRASEAAWWILGDFPIPDDPSSMPNVDDLNVFLSRKGVVLFFPLPGLVRLVMPWTSADPDFVVTTEILQGGLNERTNVKWELKDPLWLSKFHISHTLADHYSNGKRAFICGDACHTHSPLGGQGMNMSQQDAMNLAWKIAMVVQGQASEKILASYEAERRPLGQRLVNLTTRGSHMIVKTNPIFIFFRNLVMSTVLSSKRFVAAGRRRVFMIKGHDYPKSPLVGESIKSGGKAKSAFKKGSGKGMRAPIWVPDVYEALKNKHGRHSVVLFNCQLPEELSGTVTVDGDSLSDEAKAALGILPTSGTSVIIVRPDFLIAFKAQGPNAVSDTTAFWKATYLD